MVADWLSAAFRCIERDPKHVKSISDTAHDLLTGKYNKNNEGQQEQQTQQQNTSSSSSTTVVAQEGNRNILIANEVSKIAKEIGCSAAQVALNWVRQQNIMSPAGKNKVIPIIGARKETQIKDNLACLEFELTSEQMQRLNEVSKIELGFPHDLLNSERFRNIIYGGTYSLIHNSK